MAARNDPLIALLTDFGTADWFVACLKAVMLRIVPRVRLVDVTHGIPAHDVRAGAFTLAAAVPWFPPRTVFACVVDPGVGTARPLLAAQADQQLLVGPDNGLLSLALERARRVSLVRLTNPRYWLPSVSATFQGRDIIAPVAAHLALGCPLQRLGMPMQRCRPLPVPPLTPTPRGLAGRIVHIDAFGNLITNLPATPAVSRSASWVRYRRMAARMVSSYGDGRPGELVALAGSLGYLELAIHQGSAAARYGARRDERVELCDASRRRGRSS